MISNRQLRLAGRPSGLPTADIWELTDASVPEPPEGRFTVAVKMISVDPAMRGWLDDVPSYVPPVRLGRVMRAIAAGSVIASRHPLFPTGARVAGLFGVQRFASSDGAGVELLADDLSFETALSVLGQTGLTAWFGLMEVGRLRPGDTVLVSGAAGAVGSITGQLARLSGCPTVGIAGGPTKCARAGADFGYDEVIDYRSEDVDARLGELAPRGVDVYFDNVGGELLDVALMHLARGARIVVCGAISQYNQAQPAGPRNYWQLLVKRASMQGFLVFDYAQSYGQARDRMRGWLDSGRLLNAVHIERGDVDAFPELLLGIFGRQHVGKLLLEVVPSE